MARTDKGIVVKIVARDSVETKDQIHSNDRVKRCSSLIGRVRDATSFNDANQRSKLEKLRRKGAYRIPKNRYKKRKGVFVQILTKTIKMCQKVNKNNFQLKMKHRKGFSHDTKVWEKRKKQKKKNLAKRKESYENERKYSDQLKNKGQVVTEEKNLVEKRKETLQKVSYIR